MELLTATEAAEKLRLGKSTVYLLCQRGALPTVRIGTAVRIPSDELELWIRERTVSPASPEPVGA